jgi:protein-disulfide isomerase/uncharacterized membrane protein
MSTIRPTKRRLAWQLTAGALILIGIACSAYLLLRHFAITNNNTELFDICDAIFGTGCDSTIRSDWAVQLGIPLAGWGIIHFVTTAAALMLALFLATAFKAEGTLVALFLCIVAAALGIVLTAMMLVGEVAVCPLCIVVHAINILLIPVILMAAGLPVRALRDTLGGGLRYLAGADSTDPILVRWKVTGLVTVALIGIVTYQWILIQTDRQADQPVTPLTIEQVADEFESGPERKISLNDDVPRLGSAGGPLELVVFSDFQCPACRRFARIVSEARQEHPDLSVVFMHYPLGKDCNPTLRSDLHPLSCGAAYAAEAARRQGKFWEYHDALFASSEEFEGDVLERLAEEIGLDMTRFREDVADPATKSKVQADVALGKSLKIIGTPSAFLNARYISDSGMGRFDQLIDHLSDHSHH